MNYQHNYCVLIGKFFLFLTFNNSYSYHFFKVELSEQELADIVRAVMTDTSILDGFRAHEDKATIAARNAERATKQKVELSKQELADIVDGFRPLEDKEIRNQERITTKKTWFRDSYCQNFYSW